MFAQKSKGRGMKLSFRELEAATLLSKGLTKKEISAIMEITYGSVVAHIGKARIKLNCKSDYSMNLKMKETKEVL